MIRVCFVCLGNICRSPTAEGVMRDLVEKAGLGGKIHISSAGTGAWHVGEAPDPRSCATAKRRGIVLASRARHFTSKSFSDCDYVIAMDTANLRNLHDLAETDADIAKIHLLRDFDNTSPKGSSVPDPYTGGPDGFEHVFDLVDAGARGLLAFLTRSHDFPR
jgi:protein-tyrosine phosphatase